MKEIYYITSHPHKAEQISWHLDYRVKHQNVDVPEIQSLDVIEVVTHKAKEAFRLVQKPVLVEDISFKFLGLGNLPGPLIKWFLKELGVEGIVRLVKGTGDMRAQGEVVFALYDGNEVQIFKGSVSGTIAEEPKGEEKFGIDTIFIPEGYSKTWGEMNEEEQKETSMRRVALKKLEEFLKNN